MLSLEDKIAEASRLKEEGNKLFQEKEYRKACKLYRRVFAYTNGLVAKDDEQMARYTASKDLLSPEDGERLASLKASTYANLALCYLKLEEPSKAIDCAEKALQIDTNNVKALLRLGIAAKEERQWEKAKAALLRALKLDPNNSSVKTELLSWKAKYNEWQEEQSAKERELFGGKLLS